MKKKTKEQKRKNKDMFILSFYFHSFVLFSVFLPSFFSRFFSLSSLPLPRSFLFLSISFFRLDRCIFGTVPVGCLETFRELWEIRDSSSSYATTEFEVSSNVIHLSAFFFLMPSV